MPILGLPPIYHRLRTSRALHGCDASNHARLYQTGNDDKNTMVLGYIKILRCCSYGTGTTWGEIEWPYSEGADNTELGPD